LTGSVSIGFLDRDIQLIAITSRSRSHSRDCETFNDVVWCSFFCKLIIDLFLLQSAWYPWNSITSRIEETNHSRARAWSQRSIGGIDQQTESGIRESMNKKIDRTRTLTGRQVRRMGRTRRETRLWDRDARSYLQHAFHMEIIFESYIILGERDDVSSFLIANRWNPGKGERRRWLFSRLLVLSARDLSFAFKGRKDLRDFRQSHRAKDLLLPPSTSSPPNRVTRVASDWIRHPR